MILQSKELSRIFSNTAVQNQFFSAQLSLWSSSHIHMTTGETRALTRWTFVGKVMHLLFNTLSGLVIAFLPRSKCLLISRLQSLSTVILEPKRRKVVTISIVFTFICFKDKCTKYTISSSNSIAEKRTTQAKSGPKN